MPEILPASCESPVPVVARVNGHARAGGIGLIAAADLAVAPAAATFGFSEVRVGVAPAMILVPALRVVDRRFLARAVLTGEPFTADEAAAAGLLTAVSTTRRARRLGGRPGSRPSASRRPVRSAPPRRCCASLPGRDWAEALEPAAAVSAELFAGDEAAEGMAAFLEKRPPSWDTTP